MKFTDLIWELPNAVPDTLCDDLVNFFEEEIDLQYEGVTAGGVNKHIKDSVDLRMNSEVCPELDERLYQVVTKDNDEYVKKIAKALYPEDLEHLVINCMMSDTGYQIQKTVKDGFYRWHNDFDVSPVLDTIPSLDTPCLNNAWPDVGTEERLYTFIYYLSGDFEGGRTQFYFNGEIHSVTPEKGKGLWFPANTLYTHRGEPVVSGEKYLVTGWIFNANRRRASGSYARSEGFRSDYGEDNMIFRRGSNGAMTNRPL